MGSLEFCTLDCANLWCSCLCFLDAIVELHAMNQKLVNDFVTRN